MTNPENRGIIDTTLGRGNKDEVIMPIQEFVGKFEKSEYDILLSQWENDIRNVNVEHAYIIQSDGTVYHAIGDETSVKFTGVDYTNAVITHNHPKHELGFSDSFGADDYSFLVKYPQIKELRAVTYEYNYSVRVLKKLDISYNEAYRKGLDIFTPDDEKQHSIMKWLDKEGYIEYIRTVP